MENDSLSDRQKRLLAILNEIQYQKHNFLARFIFTPEGAKRNYVTTTTSTIVNFFTGGLSNFNAAVVTRGLTKVSTEELVDAGIDIERWRPMTVDTQTQRGLGYRNLISQLFHLPYCVGAHWYRWENEYYSNGYYDPRNCGVVDDYDNYYTNLTDFMVMTNSFVGVYGRNGVFSINDFYWDSLFVSIADGT